MFIRFLKIYVYLLFAEIILLDNLFATIIAKLFLQHNLYPEVLYF